MFVGLHALLSEATRVPELAVSKEEGDAFMLAAKNVMRHYSVTATQKTIDWIAFTGTVGGIYGTRIASYSMRRRDERANKPAALPNAITVAEIKPSVKTNGVKPPAPNLAPRNIPPITPDVQVDPFGGQE